MKPDGMSVSITEQDGLAFVVDRQAQRLIRHSGYCEILFTDGSRAVVDDSIPIRMVIIACLASDSLRGIPKGMEELLQIIKTTDISSLDIEKRGDIVEIVIKGESPYKIVLCRHPELLEPAYTIDEFFMEAAPGLQKFLTGRSLCPVPRQYFRDRILQIKRLIFDGDMKSVMALPPLLITIGITDQCNFKCEMCFRTRKGYVPNRYIFPDDVLRNLVLDMARMGINSLRFCGEGENMLHPRFLETILLARVVGLRIFIITNGTMLERGYRLIARCFDYIRVSFNAMTPESYQRVHGITNKELYFRVLEGLTAVRKERDRISSSRPITTMSCVVTESNISESLHGRLVDDIVPVGLDFLVLKHDRIWRMSPTDHEMYRQIIDNLHTSGIRVADYSGITSRDTQSIKSWEEDLGIGCIVRLMRANIDRFDVHSCVTGHDIYGRIDVDRLPQIWSSDRRMESQYQRAAACLPVCGQCFWGDFHRIMNYMFSKEGEK